MRTKLNILLAAGMVIALTACTSEMEEVVPSVDNERTLHTARLLFSGDIDSFDSQTRAVTSNWDDGATLYIQYTTAIGRVEGTATYSQSTGEWEVQYYGTITKGQTAKCEVYYFDNPQSASTTSVILSAQTAIFADKEASYLYDNGIVKLTAHLKPLTGRLRFRGTVGLQVKCSGLAWFSDYDIAANILSIQSSDMTLTVASDGYTPYVYATFSNTPTPQLTVDSGDEIYDFRKTFDSNVLTIGKSGYLDIPTITSRNGWQLVKIEDPLGLCKSGKHPHSINMGGDVKWACCNLGADSPIEYGDKYAWGEIESKETYGGDWSNYKWCNGNENSLTKYCTSSSYGTVDNKTVLEMDDDAARVKWGRNWRMPTIDELILLNTTCTWTLATINGVNGYKVTAKNGNVLFLPAAGGCFGGWEGKYGWYWSSVLGKFDSVGQGLYFHCFEYEHKTSDNFSARKTPLSVRPVLE